MSANEVLCFFWTGRRGAYPTTALAAALDPSIANLAEHIVQTQNVTNIPAVEVMNSLRRPILSTKKQNKTAVKRLKI